jgi:hypothetical protein
VSRKWFLSPLIKGVRGILSEYNNFDIIDFLNYDSILKSFSIGKDTHPSLLRIESVLFRENFSMDMFFRGGYKSSGSRKWGRDDLDDLSIFSRVDMLFSMIFDPCSIEREIVDTKYECIFFGKISRDRVVKKEKKHFSFIHLEC